MTGRLLSIVAFTCLGIVGCDDPEVQGKVADVMQYGAVTAELHCEYISTSSVCGSGSANFKLDSYLFLDGSNIIQTLSLSATASRGLQFNPRGTGFKQVTNTGSSTYNDLEIADGTLTIVTNLCSPPTNTVVVDLETDPSPSCTGRNLEAFGIDP